MDSYGSWLREKNVLLVVRAEDKCEQDAARAWKIRKAASAISFVACRRTLLEFSRSQGHHR